MTSQSQELRVAWSQTVHQRESRADTDPDPGAEQGLEPATNTGEMS